MQGSAALDACPSSRTTCWQSRSSSDTTSVSCWSFDQAMQLCQGSPHRGSKRSVTMNRGPMVVDPTALTFSRRGRLGRRSAAASGWADLAPNPVRGRERTPTLQMPALEAPARWADRAIARRMSGRSAGNGASTSTAVMHRIRRLQPAAPRTDSAIWHTDPHLAQYQVRPGPGKESRDSNTPGLPRSLQRHRERNPGDVRTVVYAWFTRSGSTQRLCP